MGRLKSSTRRRLLFVFPAYARSFGTFQHAFVLLGVKAFMLPQGILQIAALLPEQWEIQFIDENIQPVTPEHLDWADAVLISGMHAQQQQILKINNLAHRAGKLTVLGGPSVSAAPEFYPEVDILHCGEAGDATAQLVQILEESVARPTRQIILRMKDRFNLSDLPPPAYNLADLQNYMTASLQFSSGCPYACDFCDIPALYGRNPRYKSPQQILAELDMLQRGGVNAIYFVDDNFIANPNAALELLPHLVQWQRANNYPLRFSCEATLNISGRTQLLELMREAFFVTIFCGIETPEPRALRHINKAHNLRTPILEAVQKINSYGMEVAAGIILGLDTDTNETSAAILEFVEQSQIPLLAENLLHALPRTPLYDRLQREGRLVENIDRDSNIVFKEPYEVVVGRWKQIVSTIYNPDALYARFASQCTRTYSNQFSRPKPWKKLTPRNLARAFRILSRLILHVGYHSEYRHLFWDMLWNETKRLEFERIFHIAVVAHHLIMYARECQVGSMSSSNYSLRPGSATHHDGKTKPNRRR